MSLRSGGIVLALAFFAAAAVTPAGADPVAVPAHDAALAKALGADELGMRKYVLVVLKTGPKKMPPGPARDAMFKGHFANIQRLADQGKLALAGPLDGVDGWRGLFVLATDDLAEAKRHVEQDPVVANGEMVAEYHVFYGSAGLMLVNETHKKIASKQGP